jgi:predicted ATPase/DNA-binding SARP family transcriptional activator
VRIGLLGDVTVFGNDDVVVPLSRQLRRLVAVLALAGPAGVGTDRLAECVIGSATDGSALRMAVSRLRRHLGDMIETTAQGYRMTFGGQNSEDSYDVRTFERLVDSADQMVVADRNATLREALALWRGPALAEFASEAWAVAHAVRLEERRIQATEELGKVQIELGLPGRAVVVMEELVAANPVRESSVQLLMRALATSGRSAEALRAFHRYRVTLRDERGLDPSASLASLEAELLRDDRPNPVSRDDINTAPGSLPILLTSFVGRDAEIAGLIEATTRHRVVTITGVGGVGKTRTALQAGRALASRFRDGVWFIEFGRISDPDLLGNALAATLGVQPRPGMTLLESVYAYTAERQLLLILDNCEHVLAAAADIVDRLSRACPGVHLLVTSREGLALDGEQVWLLPPLTHGADAVQLFVDRALGVAPSFVLSDDDRVVIDEICTRLDRIPLAIELAAVRVTTLSPQEIAARLDHRFRLLTSGRRNADERHHTLRATVEWSYDLLDSRSRLLFNRLAVFAGGFSLEAAEAVAGNSLLDQNDVLDLLAGLVAKSMVVTDTTVAGGRHYRMLETLRQFALEHLVETDDIDPIKERHARYMSEFAAAAGNGWRSRDEQRWRARIEAEIDNMRAAVAWASEHKEPELAARLVAPFLDFTQFRLALGFGDMARAALATPGIDEQPQLPAVLVVAALAAFFHGDVASAADLAERAVSVSHEPGRRPTVAAWTNLSAVRMWSGDLDSAARLGHEAWEVANEVDDPFGFAWVTSGCSFVAALDPTIGIARVEHAMSAVTPVAGPEVTAWATSMAGNCYCEAGLFERAIEMLEQSVELARIAAGSTAARWTYAPLAVLQGEFRNPLTGLATARQGITESYAQGALTALVWDLESAATVLSMVGQHELASVIHAAVDLKIVAPFVIMEKGWQRDVRVRGRTATATAVGPEGAARAFQRARSLNIASLVEYTLDGVDRVLAQAEDGRAYCFDLGTA